MFGLMEEIASAACEAITTTAEVAAGVAVGVVEGAVKAPVTIIEKIGDKIMED